MTEGQQKIFDGLCDGLTHKEIAWKLGKSLRTVRHTLDRMRANYNARNPTHLVVLVLSKVPPMRKSKKG